MAKDQMVNGQVKKQLRRYCCCSLQPLRLYFIGPFKRAKSYHATRACHRKVPDGALCRSPMRGLESASPPGKSADITDIIAIGRRRGGDRMESLNAR